MICWRWLVREYRGWGKLQTKKYIIFRDILSDEGKSFENSWSRNIIEELMPKILKEVQAKKKSGKVKKFEIICLIAFQKGMSLEILDNYSSLIFGGFSCFIWLWNVIRLSTFQVTYHFRKQKGAHFQHFCLICKILQYLNF